MTYQISYLAHLEAESIHIIREAIAEAERPVLLFPVTKTLPCVCGWLSRRSLPHG
jgi:hypothetical protein